jgi:hypothetical protein
MVDLRSIFNQELECCWGSFAFKRLASFSQIVFIIKFQNSTLRNHYCPPLVVSPPKKDCELFLWFQGIFISTGRMLPCATGTRFQQWNTFTFGGIGFYYHFIFGQIATSKPRFVNPFLQRMIGSPHQDQVVGLGTKIISWKKRVG